MKNQESLFKLIGISGLGGGFAVGNKLPKGKGNLKDFKIVRITAIEGESINKLSSRLIKKLREKPKRNLEIRARQLKGLIEKHTGKGKMFIVVINKAHLLHHRTLYNLKSIHEWGTIKGTYPGFVLLGAIEKIKNLLDKNKGIKSRTLVF